MEGGTALITFEEEAGEFSSGVQGDHSRFLGGCPQWASVHPTRPQ